MWIVTNAERIEYEGFRFCYIHFKTRRNQLSHEIGNIFT